MQAHARVQPFQCLRGITPLCKDLRILVSEMVSLDLGERDLSQRLLSDPLVYDGAAHLQCVVLRSGLARRAGTFELTQQIVRLTADRISPCVVRIEAVGLIGGRDGFVVVT